MGYVWVNYNPLILALILTSVKKIQAVITGVKKFTRKRSGVKFHPTKHPLIFGGPMSLHLGVSKNRGTPKSSILIGFSIINHPFWGPTPIFGNIHLEMVTGHALEQSVLLDIVGFFVPVFQPRGFFFAVEIRRKERLRRNRNG